MSRSDARGDPQRIDSSQQMLEMQAEIFRLRNALSEAEVAGHHRIQEVHVHTRQQARAAMAHQHEAFEDVAQRYEQASANATEAAVYKELSNQEVTQQ